MNNTPLGSPLTHPVTHLIMEHKAHFIVKVSMAICLLLGFGYYNKEMCFSFVAHPFGVISNKPLSNPRSRSFTPMFTSKSCIVLALNFRSFIYFEAFLHGVK